MAFPPPFYRWRPHPWHGLSPGPDLPHIVSAYIEITPADAVKYEVDKETGYLRVDRPQATNSLPPALYGFIPQTYCGPRVGALLEGATVGDGDPLDICVLSERPITRAEVLLTSRVVGVIRLLDQGQADDKIVAVLDRDDVYAGVDEIDRLPRVLVERLRHYFLTYKLAPGGGNAIGVARIEGASSAHEVIAAARADYDETFGGA